MRRHYDNKVKFFFAHYYPLFLMHKLSFGLFVDYFSNLQKKIDFIVIMSAHYQNNLQIFEIFAYYFGICKNEADIMGKTTYIEYVYY